MQSDSPITIAIPSKGELAPGAQALLKEAGYSIHRPNDRVYQATIRRHPRFRVLFLRPTDIVEQVQDGRATLGITGFDLFTEAGEESEDGVLIVDDLGFGGSRIVVAVPEDWLDVTHIADLADLTREFRATGRTFRLASKFPHITRRALARWGIHHYQVVSPDGALEIAPKIGIADAIVDITSTGTTLRENRLRMLEHGTLLESACCLIGHAPSLRALIAEGEDAPLARLLDSIDGVQAARGLVQLESVFATDSPAVRRRVTETLHNHGARHLTFENIATADGAPSMRAVATIDGRGLTPLKRALMRDGATWLTARQATLSFDAGQDTSYDRLAATLAQPQPAN